jgi:primosomal protein N' (replication factor Y) (superfamily II helicase)
MERTTLFAEVLLPLALPKVLTYRIPHEWNESALQGVRVIVPLGKSKMYTGIIRHLSTQAPVGYNAKYIEAILDSEPIVTADQPVFWEWLAQYYCCSSGEVMNAALPGGLKLSSETRFVLAEEDWRENAELSEREREVLESLGTKSSTVSDIAALLGIRTVQPILKGLVEKGYIFSEEEIRGRYKPKTEEWVTLNEMYSSSEALSILFKQLEKSRARKQSDCLLLFLQLSGFDEGKNTAVRKLDLLKNDGINPAALKALVEKQVICITQVQADQPVASSAIPELPELSEDQLTALNAVKESFETHDVTLLHGITSSGKTELYCHLIRETLLSGKQALFLLPEIALTTQLISRLKKYFGSIVRVYHSGFSENQRSATWMELLRAGDHEPIVVLGARSSIFLPFRNLGLIIVDEEHEPSFKQHDPAPRYHARDAAIVRASKTGIKVLLGSATPSIETYWNATQKRYGLVELSGRFGGIATPEIILADIREDLRKKTLRGQLTTPLFEAMTEAFAEKQQVILFQNRRGYSPLWQCNTCGWVPMCTRCDVSMTYHKASHQLKCHYCGYVANPPEACTVCGNHDLKMLGFGTEKIEEDVRNLFPGVQVQRMDLDTTRQKSSYQRIISDFESGEIQALVGTQMVTKGLDFDHVAVVGILNADRMMNYPDFRSMERSFQLMMQVAGRAGRRQRRGKVFIQTYAPGHWLLELVKTGDYQALYEHEIRERYHFGYPPFIRLIRITLKHKDDAVAQRASEELVAQLQVLSSIQLLGPEPPYVPRINNLYLRQLLIKINRTPELARTKSFIVEAGRKVQRLEAYKNCRITIDVDPL